MARHVTTTDVSGPWSLATCRRFWEGFTPSALKEQEGDATLSAVFRVDADWSAAEAVITQQPQQPQQPQQATIVVTGDGDLDAATAQVRRFLALDVDAAGWPAVGRRDPVIADAQRQLPGLRPCGFHSPYEAAAWAVLSQRLRVVQAARLRQDLVNRFGEHGAFPAPERLRALSSGPDLDLPGRKAEYLAAVAEAALDGQLDGAALRGIDPAEAVRRLQNVKGIGPFAAELIVLRGANVPDALPSQERRLEAEVAERYGPGKSVADVADAWRPFRTWAAVHLRALRETRTGEISGRAPAAPARRAR
jgi:DNA-3-methyladenine glycosylase II